MTFILLGPLVFAVQIVTSPPEKPTISPTFIAVEPGRRPAFFVECVNTTGQATSSGSNVWPLSESAIRLDGQVLNEEGGRVGPGLTVTVQPGETWRGIIELWQSPEGVSRAVAFGAMVRAPFRAPMTAGRHTIAVRCAGAWSEDVTFFLEK